MQFFQILMRGMNFRERLQKKQTSSAVRSAKKLERKVKRLTLDLIHDFVCQIIIQVFIVLGMYNFGALLGYRAQISAFASRTSLNLHRLPTRRRQSLLVCPDFLKKKKIYWSLIHFTVSHSDLFLRISLNKRQFQDKLD